MGAAAALLMSAGLLTATVAPASAAITIGPACGYKEGVYNVCLTITQVNLTGYDVTVGFDRYMSKADADALLGCPDGSAMFAAMWRDDSAHSGNFRGYVPLRPGSPSSGTNPPGLFADFFQANMFLNRHRDSEKIFAEVTYHDCRNDIWYTYATGSIFV
ncbi:hypothetical protein Vau01_114620 [Virgisporangium aurantiacum]|uniref:Uncharacterized protein n=1 Tax=Virgisporangium aurantiacum TaxID=175570 RepID=A0A8J3ZHJ3_9ACTN|nr:hypothetical protein Vau01_114620 [Virgisporangium aurantiacum]